MGNSALDGFRIQHTGSFGKNGCIHFTLGGWLCVQHFALCWCPYIQHFAEKSVSDHCLTIDGGHYSHLPHAQTHSDVLSRRGRKFSRQNILPQGVRLQAQNYVKSLNRGFVGQKTPRIASWFLTKILWLKFVSFKMEVSEMNLVPKVSEDSKIWFKNQNILCQVVFQGVALSPLHSIVPQPPKYNVEDIDPQDNICIGLKDFSCFTMAPTKIDLLMY